MNAAVTTMRKAGRLPEYLDLIQVEANARSYGAGLSKTGQSMDSLKEHREEVRTAIEDLARSERAFRESHRKFEDLLG